MIQRTCILVKPDGVALRRVGAVVDRLERAQLTLKGLKMTRLPRAQAEIFYQEHQGKPFYDGLIAFMTAGPIVAMAWEGEEAIAAARRLMGATDPKKAEAGTLRQQFGTDNRFNLVHGSDSVPAAERELPFFFSEAEFFQYSEDDWKKATTAPAASR